MGIFRRKEPSEPAGPAPAADPAAAALADRLRAITANEAPEDALEPALQAILEAIDTQAGAVFLFDARYELLRLAAEVGISDQGCRVLRTIRRGDAKGWEMPLQSLRDRRAYLIDAASGAHHLPALVEAAQVVRSVACVPLCAGQTPLGSLVLVALEPRALSESDIRQLEHALAELVRMIEATRRPRTAGAAAAAPASGHEPAEAVVELDGLRGEVAAGLAERAALAAKLAARSEEADRLRAALEVAGTERARLASEFERTRRAAERAEVLAASLAAAKRERAELIGALEAAAAGQARAEAEHEVTRRDVEGLVETARAEADRLRVRLAEAEAAAAREREHAQQAKQEHERSAVDLHAAAAREQGMQEELRAALERSESASRERVEQALERARAAEAARAAAGAELESVRTALASAQAGVDALEAEGRRARTEIERLEVVERGGRAERERLEEELAETHTRSEELAARGRALESETGALREMVAALRAEVQTLGAERDQLRGEKAELRAEGERLAAELAAARATSVRLEEALAHETAERAGLGAALSLAEEARAAAEERAKAATEGGRLAAERDPPAVGSAAAAAATQQQAPSEAMAVVTMTAPEAARLAPVESPHAPAVRPAAGPSPASRPPVRAAHGAGRLVAVLDVDPAWARAAIGGTEVTLVAPAGDVVAQLTSMMPTRVVVNLVAPGTLAALSALRAAGVTKRFWGCLASPGSNGALALGMIEPATHPLDPDAVLAMLGGYATKGTRVVTAGADGDTLMSLRHAFTRQGLSVSMAWDAKQAVDLFGTVRPEVVVLDLELPRRSGHELVVHLTGTAAVPSIVLVYGGEDDPSAGFAAALTRGASRLMPRDRLLANVLGQSEAPLEERQQKARVLAGRR